MRGTDSKQSESPTGRFSSKGSLARLDLERSELERREVEIGIDGGNVIIGCGRSFERSVLTNRGAAELDFDDDSGMRT
jgi:hypothetical protein